MKTDDLEQLDPQNSIDTSPKFPHDWHQIRLGDVGTTFGGLTGKAKRDFGTGSATFITFMDIMKNLRITGENLASVSVSAHERQNRVSRDDILFNGSSETPEEVALAAVVDFTPSLSTYLNSFCFGYRLQNQNRIDPFYLTYYFRSRLGRDAISGLAQGATRYNIAKTKLMDFAPKLPPVAEQRAIVSALADVDELISALEALIAKKCDIKQGMRQQLLTGQTRLPGFSAPWYYTTFAELLGYKQPTNYLVSSTEYSTSGTPVLTAGKTFVLGYTDEQHGVYANPPVIIFDDFTTDSKFVDFPFKAKSSAMKILCAKPGADLRFVYELMQITNFIAVDHKRRWITEYSKIETLVPQLDEQQAIAAVLTDADAEVAALGARLKVIKDMKTGMMQQLLTGQIRLPLAKEDPK